jgi:serine/threonine protein kinase
MNPATEELESEDPRLLDAAQEYLTELESGRVPRRATYFARFPDLAAALIQCFDDIDFAHAGVRGLRPVPPPSFEPPANPLGDFHIVRELGRGGMGVVYEAVQQSLGRRVALKVLPFAAALDARQLQRFKTESHAAAQLHHANIVPVHAVGCDRGIHYYAMQLIEGRPLDRVIRQLRGVESGGSSPKSDSITVDLRNPHIRANGESQRPEPTKPGRNRSSYRQAAEMVVQVAEALEYAHDAGVVHRDIKPANLLLDAKGTVWVTDFGLAQVADGGLTRSGDVVGTLHYMSPEQATGRRNVDHRTDVYSLGATLYELLTLEPIFADADRETLLYRILKEEPQRPRSIDRGIPEDLETIVLKATAKAADERYATAGDMAEDLQRFLDDKPILARRPSIVDRGRKWLRRHPSVVAATILILAFGSIALAASTLLIGQQQRKTKVALNSEKLRAKEAKDRFNLARQSTDEMIQIADEELSDHPEQQRLRRRLLEAALAYYEKFIDLRQNDPDAKADLEVTRKHLELVLDDLAVMRGAARHMMLSESSVQEDLKVSTEQQSRLNVVFREIRDHGPLRMQDMPQTSRAERSQQLLKEMRAHETAIAAILTPIQLARLKQIALQMSGIEAFREPEIAAKLNLTSEQREQIRVMDGGGGSRDGGPGEPPPGWNGGPGPRPPGQPNRDGHGDVSGVLVLLMPEQLAIWRELTGMPFTGSRNNFRGGPPRRP